MTLVESRLDLRRGQARTAARRLTKAWDDGRLENAEGLLLLAIAAGESGDDGLAGDAIDAAMERRAEVVDPDGLLAAAAARRSPG